MKKIILFLFCFPTVLFSQVGIGTPDPMGALDINSSIDRLLISRVTLTNTTTSTIATPSISELVYNTATINDVTPGYYYWSGLKWNKLLTNSDNLWKTNGNSGINSNTDFIGTLNDADLIFKRNNPIAGKLTLTNKSFGLNNQNASTTALYNTLLGTNNLTSLTTGNDNIAIGQRGLLSNTSGRENISIGSSSLYSNTIGRENISLGSNSLFNNINGNNNISIGTQSLNSNTNGSTNIGIGISSLRRNTTGSGNIALGLYSNFNNTSGTNNITLGYNSLAFNASGSFNVAIGFEALVNSTPNTNNNIGIGYNAQTPLSTGSNQVRIGDTNITYAGIQVPWTITSDKSWKTNIKDTDLGLNFIDLLHPVSYQRKNDSSKKTEYGLIAQELETVLQQLNIQNTYIISKDDNGKYGVRYNDLIAPLIKSVQELNQENNRNSLFTYDN